MRKMFKNIKNDKNAMSKGFTLVELIVVLAIIGVLAAIIVPSMIGYVTQSRLDTANSSAKTAYNALNSYCQQCINGGIKLPQGDYSRSGGNYMNPVAKPPENGNLTPVIPERDSEVNTPAGAMTFVENAMAINLGRDFTGTVYAFSINAYGFPNGIIWAESANSRYVGGYPNIAEKTNWTLNDAKKT